MPDYVLIGGALLTLWFVGIALFFGAIYWTRKPQPPVPFDTGDRS